jgi:hypothetical protein
MFPKLAIVNSAAINMHGQVSVSYPGAHSFGYFLGLQNSAAATKSIMEVPQKLKIELPYDSTILFLSMKPKHHLKWKLAYPYSCGIIRNSLEVEGT